MSAAARARRLRRRLGEGLGVHGFGLLAPAVVLAPLAWAGLASLRHGTQSQSPPIPPWPTDGVSLDADATLDTFGSGIWRHTLNPLLVPGRGWS